MKFNDLLLLYKKIHKSNFLTIVIFTILFTLLFLIISFNISIINYIDNILHKSYDARSIIVSGIEIDKLNNIKHVDAINEFSTSLLNFETDDGKKIEFKPMDKSVLPKIINSNWSYGNDKIICPFNDNKDLIGKRFDILYEKKELVANKVVVTDTLEKTYEIGGVYNNYDYMLNDNVCLMSYEDFNFVSNFINGRVGSGTYILLVDNYENVSYVKNELDSKGALVSLKLDLDTTFIFLIFFISLFIIIVIFAITLLIVYFNIKRKLKKNEREIYLYKSMGYSKEDIINLFSIENIIIFIWSVILSIFLANVIIIIIKNLLSNIEMFKFFIVDGGLIPNIITVVSGILIPFVFLKIILNKFIRKDNFKL